MFRVGVSRARSAAPLPVLEHVAGDGLVPRSPLDIWWCGSLGANTLPLGLGSGFGGGGVGDCDACVRLAEAKHGGMACRLCEVGGQVDDEVIK